MPRVGEEKVWVEAEQAGDGSSVVLSLADVRKRRELVRRYGKHNVFTSPHRLNNFPPQFMSELREGWPVRFKMYESVYESMLNGGSGGTGFAGLAEEGHRPIYVIAEEIIADWKKPYFGAVPYLAAMQTLDTVNDTYGYDSAYEIVIYFLSNAQSWRGAKAREIKAELKKMFGIK